MSGSIRLCAAALVAVLVAGATRAAEGPRRVHDDTGATVTIPAGPCRIVSLAPGTTAMLYAAGAGHCLVGTIAHSKEPAEAAAVAVVGDAENLDFERLLALRPGVVVVAIDVVQRVRIDRIRKLGLAVYEVHVTRLAGMAESLQRLGALAPSEREATRAATDLSAALDGLRARYAGRARIRVLYQIWDRPIYTISGRHVISDALELCGAANIFDDLSAPAAPAVTREAVVLRDPDLIIASGPPEATAEWLDEWRKFPALSAVRHARLVTYSDERIDRMGPSVIAATSNLCEVIDRARPAPPDGAAR